MKIVIILILILTHSLTSTAQWTSNTITGAQGIKSIVSMGNDLFASTGFTGNAAGVVKSTNNGNNWFQINSGLPTTRIKKLIVVGTTLFAGADYDPAGGEGVYKSVNNGQSWTLSSTGLVTTDREVEAFATNGSMVFVSCLSEKVYRSTNNGVSWENFHQGLPIFETADGGLLVHGGNIYLASTNITTSSIWKRSVNGGSNWTNIYTTPTGFIDGLFSYGNKIYAVGDKGILTSTNDGSTWTQIYDQYTKCLTVSGSSVYAGTYARGVQIYNGGSWISGNNGLNSNPIILSICILNNNIFFGQVGNKIWKANMNTIGVKNISNEIPAEFNLSQNYPNPFNPTTKIKFDIIKSDKVKLIVYDILGKVRTTLVDEVLTSGSYETDFDGSNLASGVYFYKLETNDFKEVKKMMLLK